MCAYLHSLYQVADTAGGKTAMELSPLAHMQGPKIVAVGTATTWAGVNAYLFAETGV